MSGDADLEELARIVIDCGFRLHCELGPGLLESAYEALIAVVLERRGIKVARQVSMPLRHDGIVIDNAFKIDLLIENRLIVELKSIERLGPVHGKRF